MCVNVLGPGLRGAYGDTREQLNATFRAGTGM